MSSFEIQDRNIFISQINRFTNGIPINQTTSIIKALFNIKASDRESVTNFSSKLINNNKNIRKIINAISKTLASDRESVANSASKLIHHSMNEDHIENVIKVLSEIPVSDRESFIDSALKLISYQEGKTNFTELVYEQGLFISLLSKIPVRDYEFFVREIMDIIKAYIHNKIDIYKAILLLPADEIAERLRCANEDCMLDKGDHFFRNSFILALNTPLDDNRRGISWQDQMEVIAKKGKLDINVHHGGRDTKVKQAIMLLIDSQKDVKDIYYHYGLFVSKFKIDIRKDFSQDHTITYLIKIDQKELLGRLYIFIKNIQDPIYQENALQGLIKILEIKEFVCGSGILQRMVVSVLQGRLDGVNIDGNCITDNVNNDNILNQQKESIQQSIFKSIRDNGYVNKKEIIKNLNFTGQILNRSEDYIDDIKRTMNFIQNDPHLNIEYDNKEHFESVKIEYLKNNPVIQNNEFLKSLLDYHMETMFSLQDSFE